MFVAYTGYGRIATLAEEIKNPKRFIPRAIGLTLIFSAILYVAIGIVAIGTIGAEPLASITQNQTAPLEAVAHTLKMPGLNRLIAIGACTAMLGVLLNLILGLSRVVLAMGCQGDLPNLFGSVSRQNHTPSAAVIGVGIAIAIFSLTGSIETTWAFSAFTVLIYYAITNLAALQLPESDRLYPKIFVLGGLLSCLFLCVWVPPLVWLTGLGFVLIGFAWHFFIARYF